MAKPVASLSFDGVYHPPSGQTVQNAMGENVTMFMTQLDNSRAYRNCELVFDYGEEFGFDIYSTSPLDECDLTWWDNLDMDALASEFNATSITKNGPESWAMDQVMMMGAIESPTNVAGELMMLEAVLPPGATLSVPPAYEVFDNPKTQNLFFKAGLPTYRLTDEDGYEYFVESYTVPEENLTTLEFPNLPIGWTYNVTNPETGIAVNLTMEEPIASVVDEYNQTYIRVTENNSYPVLVTPFDAVEKRTISSSGNVESDASGGVLLSPGQHHQSLHFSAVTALLYLVLSKIF